LIAAATVGIRRVLGRRWRQRRRRRRETIARAGAKQVGARPSCLRGYVVGVTIIMIIVVVKVFQNPTSVLFAFC
jgi:hypothetical protein